MPASWGRNNDWVARTSLAGSPSASAEEASKPNASAKITAQATAFARQRPSRLCVESVTCNEP